MSRTYISNAELTNYYPEKIIVTSINKINTKSKHKFLNLLVLIPSYLKSDGLLVFNPSFKWTLCGAIIKILSLGKKKIVFFDLLLPRPISGGDRIRAIIKRIVFMFVDKFIFLHKDISGYSKYYGIRNLKCAYVPFKANNIKIVSEHEIRDDGYLLSCGASYRDYKQLACSLKIYSCHTLIVLPEINAANYHQSIIDESLFENNVTIVRHDFDNTSWNKILSKCRAVVLPIRSDAIQSAGISVYLEAMAFGKPVIITQGPATKDLLTEEMAAIVAPDNPAALAEAIKRVMEDEKYRTKLGQAGRNYAESLGGEDRLVKDILQILIET
jgi:glycosyltransferase involved in cell wall biosynthesis